MSAVVQAVEESLIVSVILVTHIPAYLFGDANGDSRQRGAEGKGESLRGLESSQRGADSGPKYAAAAIARVLGMAVTDDEVGPLLEIESRTESGGVNIADVYGLFAGHELTACKIRDTAYGG